MKKIKVLIADDHTIVRIGLSALLGAEPDIEIVGEAKNGEDAVRESLRTHPNVIIMDMVMPKRDGAEATQEILSTLSDVKILILTTFGTADGIARALQYGASGAIMKTADDAILVSAIRKIASGGRYVSPEIRRLLGDNPPLPDLSQRQQEILEGIVAGRTNKEIAAELGIRKDSVEAYIKTLFSKLGAANRAEAVAIALRKQLLKM